MMDELALGDYLDQAQHELFRLEVLDAYEVATDGNDFGRCLRGVLSVLAHTLCAALRRRLPGYHAATPDTLQRRFLSTAGIITSHGRVAPVHCCTGAPSGPCMRVVPAHGPGKPQGRFRCRALARCHRPAAARSAVVGGSWRA